VAERDPDYGRADLRFTARWLAGIADDAEQMPHPERLEPRTKELALYGRLVRGRGMRAARAAEEADNARINAVFDDVDVLLTPQMPAPPIAVGRFTGKGAIRSVFDPRGGAGPTVAYTTMWNLTGNPALALPAGFDDEGLPLSVQLVGPPDSEERLLSVGAQLEEARPWAGARPPIAA
jgi:amidase